MHVLVAEDVEDSRALMVALLERRGHQVTTATNGVEALQLVESRPSPPFDLILMDVAMPEMGGLTAISRIRELPSGQHLPIVLVTGGDYTDLQAWQTGADLLLRKPLGDGFVGRVESLVQRLRRG